MTLVFKLITRFNGQKDIEQEELQINKLFNQLTKGEKYDREDPSVVRKFLNAFDLNI